jgi:prefoldin subunit 4
VLFTTSDLTHSSYKVGDSFFVLPLEEVQEQLLASTEQAEADVGVVQGKLDGVREEMQKLKVDLYARFGRSINLEA